jgi:hypothetical protein
MALGIYPRKDKVKLDRAIAARRDRGRTAVTHYA